MAHIRVKAADGVLGDRFRVLDEGYVRLVGYMGGDDRILDVAKRHYGIAMPNNREAGMRYVVDRRNRDALGMVEVRLHFEMPIAEAITFVYEREANVNEFSLRYSDAQDVFHHLTAEDFAQYASAAISEKSEVERLVEEGRKFSRDAFDRYSWARDPNVDIAKEIARATLGSNLHTRFYWKISLADLLDFAVRTHQESPSVETSEYLETTVSIANRIAPLAVRTYLKNEDLEFLITEEDPTEKVEPRLQHEISPEAEELLDKPIPVLGQGYVTLIDYMGIDMSVLNAARVSTGRDEKPRSEAEDKGLISYLMRHRHTTPSEMVELAWELHLPLFVYRQGGRHRTFERVIFDEEGDHEKIEFYHPKLENIAAQSMANHQGRGEMVHDQLAEDFLRKLKENERQARDLYGGLYAAGVPTHVAKRHLPVNRFITWTFKTDLHNALHYLGLRLDPHAQLEIREPTEAMAKGVKAVAPWSYDAFERYELNGMSLSSTDVDILRKILAGQPPESAFPEGWLKKGEEGRLKTHRERDEFLVKLGKLRDIPLELRDEVLK